MARIVLISCVSKKSSAKTQVEDMYQSPLFKYNLKYAKSLTPDKIFILSAKYGLLRLEEEIEPYEETLNNKNLKEIEDWSQKVLEKLGALVSLENDEFIFLAGEKYRRFLLPKMKNYKIPLEGLGIGKQLGWLKEKTYSRCSELHELFNSLRRFDFPFNDNEIPLNGIYVLFEKGQEGHDKDRIVRVGTHTGNDQLVSRLKQHFVNENKDRSIFRKNIGRAILSKRKDPYLKIWEMDFTTRDSKEKSGHLINSEKQKSIEKEVTRYIQDNFSFVVFEILDKDKRLELESKIISTISSCGICRPSETWLGNFSPKDKIRASGLWLVNELCKEPLSEEDFKRLKELIKL